MLDLLLIRHQLPVKAFDIYPGKIVFVFHQQAKYFPTCYIMSVPDNSTILMRVFPQQQVWSSFPNIYFSDINECAEGTHRCSQKCTNIQGGYNCSCVDGFTLQADTYSCQGIIIRLYQLRSYDLTEIYEKKLTCWIYSTFPIFVPKLHLQ